MENQTELDSVGQVDSELVNSLQEKFDEMQENLKEKLYSIEFSEQSTDYLRNEFMLYIEFKGLECYTVNKIQEQMVDSDQTEYESTLIEALFYFIQNRQGSGIEESRLLQTLADDVAPAMRAINQDRQDFKDLATELTAAEQGISVEDFVKAQQ